MLVSGLIIIVGMYLLFRLIRPNKYKQTSYYQVTGKSYWELDKGGFGEYQAFKKLEGFENEGGRFLFNLNIPKRNGETTEIDLILIHPKGFFVIESKNYNGWIFGNEKNHYWTQTLPKGRGKSNKVRFYSPIRQNSGHIKHLKRLLSERIPMWSVIVFSDECTLKDVSVSRNARYKVVQLHELRPLVAKLIKATDGVVFSAKDIQWIYDALLPFTQGAGS